MDTFHLRFTECKKVTKTFPRLDLVSIINIEPEEGEGEGCEIETELVNVEEVTKVTTGIEATKKAEVVIGSSMAVLSLFFEEPAMGPEEYNLILFLLLFRLYFGFHWGWPSTF